MSKHIKTWQDRQKERFAQDVRLTQRSWANNEQFMAEEITDLRSEVTQQRKEIADLRAAAELEATAPSRRSEQPSAAQAAGVEKLRSAIMDLRPTGAIGICADEYKRGHYAARHAAAGLVAAHFATTPSEGVAAPVLEADLLALREDVAKLYQSAMAITSQAAQEFAQRVVEHVRRTHGVAPAQPSAEQVRDAALEEAAQVCETKVDPTRSNTTSAYAFWHANVIRSLKGKASPTPVAVAPVESAGASSAAGEGLTEMLRETVDYLVAYCGEEGHCQPVIDRARAILATQAERQPQPAAHAAAPEGWPGDDGEALIHLAPNFTDTAGLLQPKAGYVPTAQDFAAINYLCNEWDYGYDAAPAAVPQGVEAQKGGADHD